VKTQTKQSLALTFLAMATGLLIGGVGGFFLGVKTVQSITTNLASQGKFVCGTGLVFLPFASAILGIILGAAPGMLASGIIWLRKGPKGKSDFAAYYGR
jgi:hypothetical protein